MDIGFSLLKKELTEMKWWLLGILTFSCIAGIFLRAFVRFYFSSKLRLPDVLLYDFFLVVLCLFFVAAWLEMKDGEKTTALMILLSALLGIFIGMVCV